MLFKGKAKAVSEERCLHCHNYNEEILCEGCLSLLSNPEFRCKQCARALKQDTNLCGACIKHAPAFDHATVACEYTHPADQWVHALKYNGQLVYARSMARCIYAIGPPLNNNAPLVPVPLHDQRYFTRGYNQAFLLAQQLAKLSGMRVECDLLKRVKNTKQQSELKASERHQNVKNAFQVCNLRNIKQVTLVDDVMTTGHTLNACGLALKKAGVTRVDVVVFARA